jgi:hypothetical protein
MAMLIVKSKAQAVIYLSLLLACSFDHRLFAGEPNKAPKEPSRISECSTKTIKGPCLSDSGGESLIWVQKFTILDYKNKNVGYVNIELAKLGIRLRPRCYRINIKTQSHLPFWFFSGKSISDETEYYDREFVPLCFELKINSENERVVIAGKLADDDGKQRKLDLRWKSDKKEKSARIPLMDNICTAGSVRSIIIRNGVSKKQQYDLHLLDKYKLTYQKVRISAGEITKIGNETYYRVDLQLGLLGKFSFVVDGDGNIIEGKGMGIRLVPVNEHE